MSDSHFVHYVSFKLDSSWRRLSEAERERGRDEFIHAVESSAPAVTTYSYSALGFRPGTDLLLWRSAEALENLQETVSQLLLTGLGRYFEITQSFLGMLRPSVYTRRREPQEQAALSHERNRYLVIYPFTKTTEWYQTSKDARQGMMNEHIRIGHEHPEVRQVLIYSFGIDDQEFVVAYETDNLADYQSLVMELRETDARRFTLRDTPTLTCIHRPLAETLALLG